MEVNVCIPTLNRYDLLNQVLTDIKSSIVIPTAIYIIDNGNGFKNQFPELNIIVHKPGRNLGVAASWNWFINNVPEIRIIMNDDMKLPPDSIGKLANGYDENYLVFPYGMGVNSFSCFILPNKLIEDVGLFDETISPGYAYFEDNDFSHRMSLKGYGIKIILNTSLGHHGSSTLKLFSQKQISEHHKKFQLAQSNYKKKWGGLPGDEKYINPYNKS